MPYDNKLPRVLISENCISHLKMRVFWLSGPNGWPDKKLKHKGNVAHSTFRGGCVIDLVWKNYSLYVKIAIFSYKLDTLYIDKEIQSWASLLKSEYTTSISKAVGVTLRLLLSRSTI